MPERPKPPRRLDAAGRALWREIQRAVPEDAELDEREVAVLREACQQADVNAALAVAVELDGVVVEGSAGQPRLNAAVTELRQGRLALVRLLGELKLPDMDERPRSMRSERARRAANSRWEYRDRLAEQRRRRAQGA
jgi:phage terminase small subunit